MDFARLAQVGPYSLRLPDFWYESPPVREKPGFFGYNAIATPGVSFDFYVFLGRGDDHDLRHEIVAASLRSKSPARHHDEREVFHGIPFERHRFEDCRALAPDAVYELIITEAYGDQLHLGFAYVAPLEQEEALRHLFSTMLAEAIVDRGQELSSRRGDGAG